MREAIVEERRSSDRRPSNARESLAAPYEVITAPPAGRGEMALLAAHAPAGALAPHVQWMIAALRDQDISVTLAIEVGHPFHVTPALLNTVSGLMLRRGGLEPFGAWVQLLWQFPQLYAATTLYLLHDGIMVSEDLTRLSAMFARIRTSGADFITLPAGLAGDQRRRSDLLAAKPRALASGGWQRFMTGSETWRPNPTLRLTQLLENEGCVTEAGFDWVKGGGPPPRDGRSPMAQGRAFLPLDISLTLRAPGSKQSTDAQPPGFSIAVTRQAAINLDRHPGIALNEPLAVSPVPLGKSPGPPSITFVGGWNLRGGVGTAARLIVHAMRRSGLPVTFDVPAANPLLAPALLPAMAIRDFNGDPEVVLLQAETVRWALLEEAQRDMVRRAKRRIVLASRQSGEDVSSILGECGVDRIWMPGTPLGNGETHPGGGRRDEGLLGATLAEAALIDQLGLEFVALVDAAMNQPPAPPLAVHTGVAQGVRGGGRENDPVGDNVRLLSLDPRGAARAQRWWRRRERVPDDCWLVIAPEGARLAPDLAACLDEATRRSPAADIFYADDVCAYSRHPVDRLRLKPAFDPFLLAAQDYIGAPVMIRAGRLAALGGLPASARTAATTSLLLRAHAAGLTIERIGRTLLAHPGARVRATFEDHRRVVARHVAANGYSVSPGLTVGSLALARRFDRGGFPEVTLLVPTCRTPTSRGGTSYVEQLLQAIAETDWPMEKLTVLIGDDLAGSEEMPRWQKASYPFQLTVVDTGRPQGQPFNYAAKMNCLWQAAATEQVIMMNDDVVPLEPNWLRALQTFALDPMVAGVGARLLYPDGRLQHAGMAPHRLNAAHIWIGRASMPGAYQDWPLMHRCWSMVTGAVFATRRSVLRRVGGFDERFSLEFNDVDLCLRLRCAGGMIVYTPHALFSHAERASRRDTTPPAEQVVRFVNRWRGWLDVDPAWHPGLDRTNIEVTPVAERDAWYLS